MVAADLPARRTLATFIDAHCIDCHSAADPEADFDLTAFANDVGQTAHDAPLSDNEMVAWETMVRRLRARQMPPPGEEKPSEAEYETVLTALESTLDNHAASHPRPGRTSTVRRLTRMEYRNAVRDLLALDVDVAELLPKDESSHGFDNITVSELSPTLLNRYITAAEKISRLAIGQTDGEISGAVYRVPPDRTQADHMPGLPLGTRGGTVVTHNFPQPGEYEIQIRLARDRDEKVEGLDAEHQIDVLIDRARVHRFTVSPPDGKTSSYERDFSKADAHLKTRFTVNAGPHDVAVTFPRLGGSLVETKRQPFDAQFNRHRHPRQEPAIYEVSLVGPFQPLDDATHNTPSRDILFDGHAGQQRADAEAIFRRLGRLAYRRPVTDADLSTLMHFYDVGRELVGIEAGRAGFESGIQNGLAALLVSPSFLFRVETAPPDTPPNTAYVVDDLALASRLSFFLWSSLPDDTLLSLAEDGRLSDADVLHEQVVRMLADPRAESLVTNFADQWLYLRNLDAAHPDLRLFPDFDDNLRDAMRRETQLVFAEIIRDNRSVLDLLHCDFTYLNERLATHYDIPHVHGSQFRRVTLSPDNRRGGLLRHGSILTVTSYATRTSPTIRGNWVLENILGTPAKPPPPNVPALKEKTTLESLTVRERLAVHRDNPACASCHNLMDPIGFALDNFDAVGRWRGYDGETPIDAAGVLPDGQSITSIDQLDASLRSRPELFVGAMTEKLLTFALGRGVEASDGPAVRAVVRHAAENDYRFASIVQAIVQSSPFRMRESR